MPISSILNRLRGRAVFVSYPKSGRTWMRYVFALAGAKVKFTHAGHGTGNLREIGEAFAGVQAGLLAKRNFFMYRNPLDTAVSLYFQVHRKDLAPDAAEHTARRDKLRRAGLMPPEDMAAFVLHPVWGVENICRFNRAWLDHVSGRSDTLVLSYEDARAEPQRMIGAVLEHAGARGYDLDAIVAASSFDAMKRSQGTRDAAGLGLHGEREGDAESAKVRRGVVRGYGDYLDAGTVAEARGIAEPFGFKV